MLETSPSPDASPRPWSLSPQAHDRPRQFHILSFEGPDPYARAGGIARRIAGLTQALAASGFETRLWFVGDPDLPGNETRHQLRLHRWCQWISRYHPAGVYAEAAIITTVSRYMKHLMQGLGVNAFVIPNGLSAEDLVPPKHETVRAFRCRVRGRTVLTKVVRWEPDKRWLLAIDTVGTMKGLGWRPLLIARGGVEAHGAEVLATAAARGLRVVERSMPYPSVRDMLRMLESVRNVDIVSLRSPLDPDSRRVLFRASDAVLANSQHEPFGLVGLETMAVGGVACTGCSGEDYAVPGRNALVLETTDPREFLGLFGELRANPALERAMRQAGRVTAKHYTWVQIMQRSLLPRLRLLAMHTTSLTAGGAA